MLTGEHTGTDVRGRPPVAPAPRVARPYAPRWLRWLAVLLGALGTLLALVFPLLPVRQDTAELRWPTVEHGTAPVTAPLVSYRPESLRASIGCQAIRDLDARTAGRAVVLSTTPPASPTGPLVGMTLEVTDGKLLLTNRGRQLATGTVPAGACTVDITSDVHATTVVVGGTRLVAQSGDVRPQVVGVYSDLDGTRDRITGTSVRITVDTRFVTTASALKITAGALAGLAFLGSLWALHALDVRAGRRAPRLAPRGWWRPTTRDVAVVVVLAAWLLIGSLTSDDGYILTMVRARDATGYVGNYYRWFDVPEAPFGWFYEVYSAWVRLPGIGLSAPWLRLPSFLMGVLSWLLISREMLPRLGRQVRRSAAAGWAAAAVFCCFWLPYDNGLRPEPVVVVSALLALCAVERAVATRRLVPVALGLVAAAFAVAATPTGLIAVAPFLAAGRPLLRLVRHRAGFGWATVLAPILASGTVVLVAVFADQTLAAVLEAIRVRTQIGPNLSWFQEPLRYQALFSDSPDGSLARRFPVLLLLLCVAVCLVVLLRRTRIQGAALGPSRRLIGSTLVSFALLALTPTKWTHHFGAFAALGAGTAALAALATSASVLRSKRNRSVFTAGVFGVAALAFTGPNSWWYVSDWRAFSADSPPALLGHSGASFLLLAAAGCLVVAVIEHMRGLETDRVDWAGPGPAIRPERHGRALRLGSAPLAVVCGLLVLFEIASMAQGMALSSGSYSLGMDILTSKPGSSCGLSDKVLVEAHPADGVLSPLHPVAPATLDPANAPITEGFVRNGVPPPGGGTGASEQDYTLTNGLGGDNAPVWGSYDPGGSPIGELRTAWFGLPLAARRGDVPLVVSAAGRLRDGNSLTLQFGLPTSNGVQVIDSVRLDDQQSGEPTWRDLRVNLSGRPAALADQVRVVAEDRSLGPDGWLAITPPRVPKLVPLSQVVGRDTPMYLEWPVGFPNPCLRPFAVHDGIAEMPAYRLIADDSELRNGGLDWSDAPAGGPMGWLSVAARQQVVPAYLAGDWPRDWGELRLIRPYAPNAVAPDVVHGQVQRWGWYSTGPLGDPPPGTPTLER